jgi:hypothetical protein
VTYAYNDVQRIKAQHMSDNPTTYSHVTLIPSSDAMKDEATYGKYFSQDSYGSSTVYAYNNLFRYNTVAELISAGVTAIGTWEIKTQA